ncbi:hypothetical protein FZD47_12890 [Bacillus infantis]|uniref:Uncharacterized protein n=1 Tax=Bacillus infantis TaxID=324767 RepID=A0A5D4SLQ2_9BACI|nr:hypothetical protein [Bacillus infantis]TYS64355.1 hypothetical protein FZD47_12890 [Bacillus infantis]
MALVNELTKAEEKLIEKMTEGNSNIQLLASDGENSFVCIGDKRIDPIVLLLCHITPSEKVCNGNIGSRKIALSNEQNITNHEVRIIVDRRDSDGKRFYCYSKEAAFVLKDEDEENEKNLLIAYIENQSFAQLTIFNSTLQGKISEIIVRKESLLKDLRNNAFTLVTTLFPAIHNLLLEDEDAEICKIKMLKE